MFNTCVQSITQLLAASLDEQSLITLHYRMNRSIFDIRKLKAKTKISKTRLLKFQYADDCALVADSPVGSSERSDILQVPGKSLVKLLHP